MSGLELVGIFFIFEHIESLGGWSRAEVIYLFGVASISLGLGETITSGLKGMSALVRTGGFDHLLVRPIAPLLQILVRDIRMNNMGRLLQGIFALSIAFHGLDLELTPGKIGMLSLSILCSAVVYMGLFIAGAANCFWTVQNNEMFNAFTYGGVEMTQFPITVYQPWLRNIFLYVIPVGFTSYFPALVVLGKADVLGYSAVAPYLTPLVAGVFFLLCLGVWYLGMRHYQSTGS